MSRLMSCWPAQNLKEPNTPRNPLRRVFCCLIEIYTPNSVDKLYTVWCNSSIAANKAKRPRQAIRSRSALQDAAGGSSSPEPCLQRWADSDRASALLFKN